MTVCVCVLLEWRVSQVVDVAGCKPEAVPRPISPPRWLAFSVDSAKGAV